MKPTLCLIALLGLVIATPGCGDDDGYYGGLGAPCSDDRDCPVDAKCEDKKAGGYCTWECRFHDECPPDSACVDAHGGTCHLLCSHASDCPAGFKCKDKKNEREGGHSFVCEP